MPHHRWSPQAPRKTTRSFSEHAVARCRCHEGKVGYLLAHPVRHAVGLFDPRTKLSSFELDEQETSIATFEECYKLYMPTGETRIEKKPKSTFTLFKSLMRDNTTGQPRVSNEIESYLALNDENEDMDPLAWWQIHEDRYPTLARAARDYLGIQATSVPCEQTFSVAKNTISLVRNRIDGENARASLCLKSWYLDPDL